MRLIATKRSAADKYDQLSFVRGDGSSSSISMPRQGILPHDLIHYVVESQLPFQFGFLRLVASGADAGFVMEEIHDVTSHKVSVEAVQVEAIVEALQTQLWSGAFDEEMFLYAVEMACTARKTMAPVWQDENVKGLLFQRALELATEWQAVPVSSAFELVLA